MNSKTLALLSLLSVGQIVPLGAAPIVLSVTLNTSSLAASSSGPFTFDAQLNDGGTPNTNAVQLSNFSFGGGGPLGAPTLTGGATGKLSTAVQIVDSSFLNQFDQKFTAGNTLSFLLSLTTNPDPSGTPDQFSFAILDNTATELPTMSFDILGTSVILVADLTGSTTQLMRFGSASGAAITFAAPTLASPPAGVPEPSTFLLLLTGLAIVLGAVLRGRW